jgi:uncharacterized protein
MNIFLDTSSLIKLYHYEEGTDALDQILIKNTVTGIFLSELAKVEYDSAVWKVFRTQKLTHEEVESLISSFETDYPKYNFVRLNTEIVDFSKLLIAKYGVEGLRTLDSLQLASVLKKRNELEYFITADKLLKNIASKEGLPVL